MKKPKKEIKMYSSKYDVRNNFNALDLVLNFSHVSMNVFCFYGRTDSNKSINVFCSMDTLDRITYFPTETVNSLLKSDNIRISVDGECVFSVGEVDNYYKR